MNDNTVIKKLDNLKKIRESRNITQLKLSVELGVSQELISRYEVGSSFPQPQMLIKLAEYFNCSVDYLLGVTDIPTPIKLLTSNTENLKSAELYNKYNSLSDIDKSHFESYLNYLLNKEQKRTLITLLLIKIF